MIYKRVYIWSIFDLEIWRRETYHTMRQSFNPLAANNIKTSTALLVDTGDKLRREQTLNWPRVKKTQTQSVCFFFICWTDHPIFGPPRKSHPGAVLLEAAATPESSCTSRWNMVKCHGASKKTWQEKNKCIMKKHWLCNHISKAPSCTRSCSGVDAECPSVSLPVTLSSNCCSLSGTPETIIRLGSKWSQSGNLPSSEERLNAKMSPSGSEMTDRGIDSVNSWPAVAVIPGKWPAMKGLKPPEPTFSKKPVLADRPDDECVPFKEIPSSVSWEGVPVNDICLVSNFSQLGKGEPSAKDAVKLTPVSVVTPSGTWNPNGLATSAVWSGTTPRLSGPKEALEVPDVGPSEPELFIKMVPWSTDSPVNRIYVHVLCLYIYKYIYIYLLVLIRSFIHWSVDVFVCCYLVGLPCTEHLGQ